MKTFRNAVCALFAAALLSAAGVARGQGHAWAWGDGGSGQLGNGTFTSSSLPVPVTSLSGLVAVAGGGAHSLALKNDGTVWAWGNNYSGQLGNGTTTNSNLPVQVSNLSGAVAVAAGSSHSLALKSDGTVWAWGYNGRGELGDGTLINRNLPVQVKYLFGVVGVAGGSSHSLALKNDGTVWVWGSNGRGQLGIGSPNSFRSTLPVQVKNLSGVVAVAAGSEHSLAVKNDGTVWAWGYNLYGQVGDGTISTKRIQPVQAKYLSGVVAVAGGGNHSLAVKNDGTVWAWGRNGNGQLGNGTFTNSSLPVLAKNLSGVVTVTGGGFYSLALKNDSTVWAWGFNNHGQLGDGTRTNRSLPVPVTGLSDMAAIAAGYDHSLAAEGPLVEPSPSALTLFAATGPVGGKATLSATLEDAVTGAKLAGRRVYFTIDGADAGMATTDTFGVARYEFTVPVSMALGSYSTAVSFAGDPYNAPSSAGSTLTIVKGSSLIFPAATGQLGGEATLRATLEDEVTGVKLEGRTVLFKFDGAEVGTAVTDANGVASYTFLVPEDAALGSHPTAASFAGDQDYAPATASSTLTITKSNATLTLGAATGQIGGKATLHATLRDRLTGTNLAGRTVLFKIDGTEAGTDVTDAGGVARYELTVPEGTALGSHPTVASFAGEEDYAPTSASSTLTISKRKVTLFLPSASGYPGQTITFSATLETNLGTALVGRTINFSLDGSPVGSATTDSAGKAKLGYTIPANAALGTHALTASFAGDSNYEAAAKDATLTVNKIPVRLPVYPNSGYAGTTVNLCARLFDAFNVPMVGATLSYSVNGAPVGSVVTDGTGQAKLPYAIPVETAAGPYPFTVTFAGDATHLSITKPGTLTVK